MANGNSIVIRPLGQMAAALSRFGQKLFQAPDSKIDGIELDAWLSPLQPTTPWAPEGTEPRGFQYWSGQNLLWQPRPDAEWSAADLKQLGTYPLARVCIENVKDIICDISWEIQAREIPGESEKNRKKRTATDKNLVKLNRFFEKPDREHSWDLWLRPFLEDMLVIDAGCFLVRKTFSGDVVELANLRGESIVRYIDENGFTPIPPSPAYAQNWWGAPLVNLTTDQLIYKPRNIVPRNTIASQLYGMSPVEQVAQELQIGQARLDFVYAYYKEGSIPGVIQVVPRGTPPEKISEAMKWMNSELAGNLAARRQWRMVQGFNEPGKAEQIEFTKEALLADPFDDMHIRKVCFAFGTSPQRLMKMIRTEGVASKESAEIEGTLPFLRYVKTIVDHLIQYVFGMPEYEWVPNPFKDPDPTKIAETLKTKVGSGLMTLNEGREELGYEPDSVPEADMLGTFTASGFTPIGMGLAQAGAEIDGSGKITIKPKETTPNAAAQTTGSAAAAPAGAAGAAKGEEKKVRKGEDIAVVDLGNNVAQVTGMESMNVKLAADSYEQKFRELKENGYKQVRSAAPLRENARAIWDELKERNPAAVSFTNELGGYFKLDLDAVVFSAIKLSKLSVHDKRKIIHPGRLNPRSILARHELEKVLINNFRTMRRKASKQLLKGLKLPHKHVSGKVKKQDESKKAEEALQAKILEATMNSLAADWEKVASEAVSPLQEAALSGSEAGGLQVQITDETMLETINQQAREWAAERAAELVGMKWVDGELIENPNAEWAITETTRERLRAAIADIFAQEAPTMADVEAAVAKAGIFDEARAMMIAKTEVTRAQVQSNLMAWVESGVVSKVDWVLSDDHDIDDECDEAADGSPYEIEDVPEFPMHPNCECGIVINTDEEGD
jgi:hypothetical protein